MRRLLALCSEYAKEYSISFNASKTKSLAVIPRTHRRVLVKDSLSNFLTDNNPIGFVDSFKQLGHIISSRLTDDEDIASQQSSFVGQVNNTLSFSSHYNNLFDVNYFIRTV